MMKPNNNLLKINIMSKKNIASISISGELTLNMHSLNNEGGEGNQIMTRQLTIVDKEGQEHTVNGISGDMFKHIHVGHLINLSEDQKLPLCEGCSVFNPNRIGIDANFLDFLKKANFDITRFSENDKTKYTKLKKALKEENEKEKISEIKKEIKELEVKYVTLDKDKLSKVICDCIIDDTHGILITAEKNNLPRKSVIEFGWTIGIPGKTNTETYLHTKIVPDSIGVKGEGSNVGQNIFHRPANHGAYAFVCNIDVYRIGFNDISRKYSIDDAQREKRYKVILQALLSSILNPQGAMTSSQKPHITDFKGVVSYSEKLTPAPTISALNEDYKNEIIEISKNLNEIEKGSISVDNFSGLGEFSKIIKNLISENPYKIR